MSIDTTVCATPDDINGSDIFDSLISLRSMLTVIDLTARIHDVGCALAEQHQFSVFDAFIVVAAIDAKCTVLMSEDMQDGRAVNSTLRIEYPFSVS